MPEKNKKEMKKSGVKSDADLKMDKKTGLGSTSEKEQEIDKLLTEEEELEANYKRIEKQGMSDQIANREQLKALAKDVYEGAKSGAKKIAKKVKGKVSELLKKDK
jgi:hypothetical protein